MPDPTAQPSLSLADRSFLLRLARESLSSLLVEGRSLEVEPSRLSPALLEQRTCFVTLTSGAELRGCVGQIKGCLALYRAVMDNAAGAAFRDPRFPPVTAGELSNLHIEISVLSRLEPLEFASPDELLLKLQPHVHGVVLSISNRMSTFLPQVWAQVPDKEQFMNRLAQKGGHSPNAWRGNAVSISTYTVEHFDESDPHINP